MIQLERNVDGRILSSEIAGEFIRTDIGMYAISNVKESRNLADSDWFEYQEI